MKNAITLQKAQEIQRDLAASGHIIELEMLTDCATIPEEDEEADHIALAPATYAADGAKIPSDQTRKASELLKWCLFACLNIDPCALLDASTEEGNAALANGYAAHGAIDNSDRCHLWIMLPLTNN